jgi:Cu-Zn family superoxide dismutase
MIRRFAGSCILALSLGLSAAPVAADGSDTLHPGRGWATAPVGAASNGAAFLTLFNTGAHKAELVGAEAPEVTRVELHRTTMVDGVMRMRPVETIEVPARGHTALRPGGLHIMLIGAGDLAVGADIPVTLRFADAGTLTVDLPVRQAGTKPAWLGRQALVDVHRITAQGVGARVGTLALREHAHGLLAMPLLQGLRPGPHAVHVHTKGSCAPGERDSGRTPGGAAGGHFDPDDSGRYAGPYKDGARGDLPNLVVEANGTATIPVLAPRLDLASVRGRSVMIHAGADRYGPRLPGADALAGAHGDAGHAHADARSGHGGHGGMRMFCGVIPE